MKRILVPTDFSTFSKEALKVAAQIARDHKSEIIILHMLELPHQGSDAIEGGKSIPEIMLYKNKAIERLEELMDAEYLKGINVSQVIEFKKVHEGVLDACEKNDVNLVIMGSHGVSGFDEMIVGSNAEKVVRYSTTPVLIIKKEAKDFRYKNFVFASDFSEETKEPFAKMLELVKKLNSKLSLVMISSPNSFKTTHDAEKTMSDFLANFKIGDHSTHLYNDINIETGIINFAKSINADMIGICTHGRTGLAHFFNGSIGEGLVNHAIRPVVTFKI